MTQPYAIKLYIHSKNSCILPVLILNFTKFSKMQNFNKTNVIHSFTIDTSLYVAHTDVMFAHKKPYMHKQKESCHT